MRSCCVELSRPKFSKMKTVILKTDDEDSKRKLYNVLKELKPGSYVVEIKKNRNVRSLSANRYYHAILNIACMELDITHENMHEAMKYKFNSTVVFFPKGGSQCIGNTTSDLDTKEFTAFVNRVKQYLQDDLGIIIPEAKDIDYGRWIEIQNSYDDNFPG